jgi:hypothetical protein
MSAKIYSRHGLFAIKNAKSNEWPRLAMAINQLILGKSRQQRQNGNKVEWK